MVPSGAMYLRTVPYNGDGEGWWMVLGIGLPPVGRAH